MFKLIIADDEGKTTVVPLVRDEITVGRREGNTIRLTERNISRRHARLVRNGDTFLVEDLESYNGVKLNGLPIAAQRPLNDGDQLTIGDYQLSFRSDRPVAHAAPAPAPPLPPAHPRLVMLGPPEPGREFSLTEPEVVIGRTDENGIVINHRSISRSHARITMEEGVCRLHDLDSANGVRVNGEDYKEVELRRGDLVELGTVRLRFVAAGEAYQFDADATVQIDAFHEPAEERRSPVVAVVVGLLVLGLLGAGAYVALTLRDEGARSGSGTGATHARPDPGPPPPLPEAPNLTEVKAHARHMIERELYGAALDALSAVGPTADAEVRQLRAEASSGQENLRLWQSACSDTEPSDVETMHDICQRIDAASRYRHQGCCGEAAEQYGRSKIAEARRLFRGREFEKALALATAVTEDRAIPERLRTEAQDVVSLAQKRLEVGTPPVGPDPGGDPTVKTPGKVRPPPPPPPPPTGKVTGRRPAEEALVEARGCVLRNDQACCIRALSGAERTTQVVNLLVDCYARAGRIDQACRLAEQYPRCVACRQFFEARCR